MGTRIVFVVMSAVHSALAVDQLARSLSPHRVLVHHDFSQTPEFSLSSPNAEFVPEPKRTGWANWGFSEGIFHALRYALDAADFDYLQLLTPCCLPIKPIAAFASYVDRSRFDANFDCVDLLEDQDALMSVGWRAFSPEHTLRHRVLRRLSRSYFRDVSETGWRHVAGVSLRTGFAIDAQARMKPVARLALNVMRAASRPSVGRHPFDGRLRPCFGATWFGARREVISAMVEMFAQPDIHRYFSRLRIADEFLIPSLLRRASQSPGPGNHLVNTFNGARPLWFEAEDFDRLCQSTAWFARKFRDDPGDVVRGLVLDRLAAPAFVEIPSGRGRSVDATAANAVVPSSATHSGE